MFCRLPAEGSCETAAIVTQKQNERDTKYNPQHSPNGVLRNMWTGGVSGAFHLSHGHQLLDIGGRGIFGKKEGRLTYKKKYMQSAVVMKHPSRAQNIMSA